MVPANPGPNKHDTNGPGCLIWKAKLPLLSLAGSEQREPYCGAARHLAPLAVRIATDDRVCDNLPQGEIVDPDAIAHCNPARWLGLGRIGWPRCRATLAGNEFLGLLGIGCYAYRFLHFAQEPMEKLAPQKGTMPCPVSFRREAFPAIVLLREPQRGSRFDRWEGKVALERFGDDIRFRVNMDAFELPVAKSPPTCG